MPIIYRQHSHKKQSEIRTPNSQMQKKRLLKRNKRKLRFVRLPPKAQTAFMFPMTQDNQSTNKTSHSHSHHIYILSDWSSYDFCVLFHHVSHFSQYVQRACWTRISPIISQRVHIISHENQFQLQFPFQFQVFWYLHLNIFIVYMHSLYFSIQSK